MAYIKNPSKEQKEMWSNAAKEKEDAAHKMIKDLAEGYKTNPEDIAELFKFGSNFYDYSIKNTMLIYSQNPYAQYVQSFKAWKDMGYSVNKGEKGLSVFVPVECTYLKISDDIVQLSKATKEQAQQYKTGIIEGFKKLNFSIGNVFDISQTNFPKEEYPKLFSVGYESEYHANICKGLEVFSLSKLNCPVTYDDLKTISLRGCYYPIQNSISINTLLEDTQKLSTLSHELGHALIHYNMPDKSTALKEFEADAVSIMIQSNFGVELTDSRKNHLADHYKALEKEYKDIGAELKIEDAFSSVYSTFKDNIADIQECVDSYLVQEKILANDFDVQKFTELDPDDLKLGVETINKLRGKSENARAVEQKAKNTSVEKACIKVSNKYKKLNLNNQINAEIEL